MNEALADKSKEVADAIGSWQRYTVVAISFTVITVFAIWSMREITEQAMRLTNAALAACGGQ